MENKEENGCERSISEQMHKLLHKALDTLEEILDNGSDESKIKAINILLQYSGNTNKQDKFLQVALLYLLSNIKPQLLQKEDSKLQQEIVKLLKNFQMDKDNLN